ncbi:MAG: MATE family efflux transporter [Proteobacteria bacterium]|nr:MATE family efflux transporter [Pseudomonadota bacterium]
MQDMTVGSPWKGICVFALPVFAGMFLQQLYNTVGSIIVGNYAGEQALAAVGTVGCLVMLFLAVANGFSAGAGIVVAQAFGAKNRDEMRLAASTSLILQAGLTLVCGALAVVLCRPVLSGIMGLEGTILSLAETYFLIYCLGFPFQFGYNIVAGILRGIGDSRATLYFLIIASVINIGLNLLFVGALGWGVVGSALATDLAQACSFVAAWIYMRRVYPEFRFGRKEYRYDRALARRVMLTGYPMALQQVIVSLGFILIQRAVVGYGQAMLASYTVTQRLECYLFMPAAAFQVTMATYTGQNVGARRLDRIRLGVRQMIVMAAVISVVIAALFLYFEPDLIGWFGISDEAFGYCMAHLQTTALAILILDMYFPVFGVYQGANHALVPTLTALTVLCIRVLTVYTLCEVPAIGYRIVWLNQPIGFAFGIAITWLYYFYGSWRRGIAQAES